MGIASAGEDAVNLETAIDARLWRSVQSAFASRNYTAAILDAIYFVGDLIREKTGLQSDGVALVGQAFGGKAPALKVNKLQTDSERNIQAGVEQLLRGIFQAIRNPRSHEKITDTQENAVAIILFLNYIVTLIDTTKAIFSRAEFITRVFDKNFVANERYAKLLVAEVPQKQRLETMIDVFRAKKTGDGKKLKYFVRALYSELVDEEKQELHAVVSDELKLTEDETEFRLVAQLFSIELIEQLPEVTRLRFENRLIQSLSEGDYNSETEKIRKGALGTWIDGWADRMLLKDELQDAIATKFFSRDIDEHAYVENYFASTMEHLLTSPSSRLTRSLKLGLSLGSEPTKRLLDRLAARKGTKVNELFAKELNSFVPKKQTSDFSSDEIPF